MSVHKPNEFMMKHCDCHVCGERIFESRYAIEHSGAGQYVENKTLGEGFVSIWLHPECATVLALRLAHDVMRIPPTKGQPRAVDLLQHSVKATAFIEE